jgi:hypothetical protein
MDTKAVLAEIDALKELVEKTATRPRPPSKTRRRADRRRADDRRGPQDRHRARRRHRGRASPRASSSSPRALQTLAERVERDAAGPPQHASSPASPTVEVAKTATDDDDVQKTAEAAGRAGDLSAL